MTAPPVKRGPGRPRKHPLPEGVAPAAKDADATEAEPAKRPAASQEKSSDPRIGMEVHPDATAVGFDDGAQYLADGGVITERLA